MTQENFEVKLPLFEGPFDLLLFFIERDELDIYDIPISKITNDFLDYIKQLEILNIEVASEFILVASTLMRSRVNTRWNQRCDWVSKMQLGSVMEGPNLLGDPRWMAAASP